MKSYRICHSVSGLFHLAINISAWNKTVSLIPVVSLPHFQPFLDLYHTNISTHACVCVCVYTYADFPSGTVVKNPSAMQEPPETWVRSLCQEDPWKRKWQHTPIFLPGEFHRGGWQVTVPRVAKSQTQLKRLSGMCVCLCVRNTQQNWSYKQLTVV